MLHECHPAVPPEALILVPRRVVLLTRDASLAVAVKALLGDGDRVTELESPQELPSVGELPVDAVVVDLPGSSRAATLERVRGRFSGPLVVLLGHGEDAAKARAVYRCSVLARPFGMSQLWSLLVDSATEAVTEVLPAVQRRDPSQRPAGQGSDRPSGQSPERPSPPTERPGESAERSGDGAQRPAEAARPEGGAGRPDRPAPGASERPEPSRQPEPERPARVADQADLAPERQANPEEARRPAVPAERQEGAPRERLQPILGPQGDRLPWPQPPTPGERPERPSGTPSDRPWQAAPAAPMVVAPAEDRRAGAEAKPAGKEARKPPPWNWRSRRFKAPPPEPVDPEALTQPMPRLRPGNGAPPAPIHPMPKVNGAPSRPSEPAPPVDRRDRLAAAEKEAAPAVDRAHAAEPRDAAPAVNRGDAAAAATPGLIPTALPPLLGPKLDWPDAPTAEPRKPEQPAGWPVQVARTEPAERPDPDTRSEPAARPQPAARADEIPPDPPEAVAGRLAERLGADAVALLLDNNKGLLEVAGGIGLTTAERQLQVEYSHEVLLELFRVGVGLIEDTEHVRGLIRGIPGCNSQSLVMVPLVHEGHGFGALIIGRTSPPGQPRPEFTEAEIEALMDFAEDVAAPLRSTVLLRRLKGQLNTPDRT